MLGIFGKKSDHPLANLKSAQQTLDDIPKNDAMTALGEITEWIESLLEQGADFRLDHKFAVLRMFDEAAQPHVRRLLREFFVAQPLTKFQENRLWTGLYRFYTQTEQAYYEILAGYRDGARGASGIKSELALLGARGVAALNGRLKLAAARYAMVDHVLWQHLADFCTHSEDNGYRSEPVTLYPNQPGTTSVVRECGVLMMWYGVSDGRMTPLQVHIVERLLAHVGHSLQMSKKGRSWGLFFFDVAQPTAPIRANADVTLHPTLRFVGGSESVEELNRLSPLLEKGILPEEINFYGAKYDVELVRDILQRLLAILTQPLPERRTPRRQVNVPLQVANGYAKLLEQTDLALNFDHRYAETWEAEDISASGYRLVVPYARAEGVKIGSLIGSKPEKVPHWNAGIVRRLSRDADNKLHIGVEVLSTQVIGVSLGDKARPGGEEQVAMYLNRPNDTSGEAWLLMRAETFSPSRSLTMTLKGNDYLLLPIGLSARGDDFDLARFRLMQQDAAAEA